MLYVSNQLTIAASDLTWRFSPSGGPGGQHANKAYTRADVVFSIQTASSLTDKQRQTLLSKYGEEMYVSVDETRSQYRNKELAMQRLADKIRQAFETPKKRQPTKPSRGAVRRRLTAKKQRSEKKANRRKPVVD